MVLADRGERVLAFVPRNRHHAFSVAANVGGEDVDLDATADGRLVRAYLRLADFEMGSLTVLNDLIRRGVSVHSSALLDAERAASEIAFQRGLARVMVATGTLAQGLNLPATAVLIGGTEIGFSANPEPDSAARGRAQLLNAIGRSGRPGVANHGLALVIPNNAISFSTENLNIPDAFQRAEVLAYEDASIPLVSRLTPLVTSAIEGSLVAGSMSTDEMVAYAYLPEADAQDALAQRILQRSYGVWQSRPEGPEEAAAAVVNALQGVGQEFVAGADAPQWTTEVAYRSGLALPDVFMLYRAASGHLGEALPEDIERWLVLLINVLQAMPASRARALLFGDLSLAGLSFAELGGDAPSPDAWRGFTETILRYLRGDTIASIATFATQTEPPVDPARTVGSKPIPKTLSLIQQIAYRLSLTAGALAALWVVGDEQGRVDEGAAGWLLPPASRWALDALPLAVRCGASGRSSLAWYRFGIRHRVAAQALARSFPLPEELEDETDIRAWVRETRRAWLSEEVGAAELGDAQLARAIRLVANYEGV